MTADEPVAGVPRLCARQSDCARPRGHDDECGPDRADTELADLRAEVERHRLAVHDVLMACMELDWATDGSERSMVNHIREVVRRWREAEGVARTNAAWVQQQHAAAKEAREQRDALQRQVDAVRALFSDEAPVRYRKTWFCGVRCLEVPEWAVRMALRLDADAPCACNPAGGVKCVVHAGVCQRHDYGALEYPCTCGDRAALDAVEPADQPHPIPEADKCSTCGGPLDSPPCSLNRELGISGHTGGGGFQKAGS